MSPLTPEQLAGLQPFIEAVRGWRGALAADHSRCRCQPGDDGRYQISEWCRGELQKSIAVKTPGPNCWTATIAAVRAHIAALHLPQEHLTDVELKQAVKELDAAMKRLPEMTAEDAQRAILSALEEPGQAGR